MRRGPQIADDRQDPAVQHLPEGLQDPVALPALVQLVRHLEPHLHPPNTWHNVSRPLLNRQGCDRLASNGDKASPRLGMRPWPEKGKQLIINRTQHSLNSRKSVRAVANTSIVFRTTRHCLSAGGFRSMSEPQPRCSNCNTVVDRGRLMPRWECWEALLTS